MCTVRVYYANGTVNVKQLETTPAMARMLFRVGASESQGQQIEKDHVAYQITRITKVEIY